MRAQMQTLVKESSLLNIFKKQSFSENKLTLAVISLFPMIFVTKTIEAAFVFGLVVLILLIITSLLTKALGKVIEKPLQLLVAMVVLITLSTITKMLLEAFIPNLTNDFGIYVIMLGVGPLLYLNVFHANENNLKVSVLESLGTGMGVIITLVIVALFREVLGSGVITIGKYLPIAKTTIDLGFSKYAITNLLQPYGALIIFGLLLSVYVLIKQRKEVELVWLN